jgi:hypothetical protein
MDLFEKPPGSRDMATVFPGMDPYLEDPQIWPGVHSALVVYIRDQLQPTFRKWS